MNRIKESDVDELYDVAEDAERETGSLAVSFKENLNEIDRRTFLRRVGLGMGAGIIAGPLSNITAPQSAEASFNPSASSRRARAAFNIRMRAATMAAKRRQPRIRSNHEEEDYPYIANFSKCLPHNELGEVESAAYKKYLKALSGSRRDYDRIPLGATQKFTNPQCGIAYDLEGPDCHHLKINPAPRIDSPCNSAEMGELYWQALLRDLPFTEYATDPLANQAAEDMSRFSDFRGPKTGGRVAPHDLFRGTAPGCEFGPYISQFMLIDVPYGAQSISQKNATILPNIDFLTRYEDWLACQRGFKPTVEDQIDPERRYIRNGRDLVHYVHIDQLYQAYLNACLILLGQQAPVDSGNPYAGQSSADGFCTFGMPHIMSLVTEVATRALKAQWFQKWYVHRRIRPEAFAGRVHNHLLGKAAYPINSEIFNSAAIPLIADHNRAQNGGLEPTFLLPMGFPEGCPAHPAYGSGHATVAGACVTILKAWFDENHILTQPVVASADGSELLPYRGQDAHRITVGAELNKLAYNIAMGRDFAGVHWRSDGSEAMRLGEEVAIGILQEQAITYFEKFSFTFTRFNGKRVRIKGGGAKTV